MTRSSGEDRRSSQQQLATDMLAQCRRDGQAVRRVATSEEATGLRRMLVQLSRMTDMRIRTVRLRDAVAVVRLDAQFWSDDRATRREKLQLPPN